MSIQLDVPPLCLKSNSDGTRLIVGCVDGSIRYYDTSGEEFEELWRFKTKSSVRGVDLDERYGQGLAVIKNRALCVFDLETGRRTRCILKCHSDLPTAICVLPPTALKNQQIATADESGVVKTWDLRADEPLIREWKEQEEEINELRVDSKSNLIASSSDGTIAAFDLRKAKKKVRSEALHSELFGICPTEKYVYVGGEDGYVEVFNINEYGNILQRIESGFEMGVSGIVELRRGLLLLSSSGSNKLRLLNVEPSKRLGIIGCHGDEKNDEGIDAISLSADKTTLFSIVSMDESIKKWDLVPIVKATPVLRAQNAKTKKKKRAEGFFDDLEDEVTRKRRKEEEEEDEEEDSNEEEDDEEEEEEDEEEEEEGEDED